MEEATTMTQDAIRPLDLGSVDHVLRTTRSVRQRLDFDRAVPMSLIEEALDIALQAPTGANTQTWRFMVVTDAAKRQKLADYYRLGAEAYVAGQTALSKTGVTMMREYDPEDIRQQQRAALMKSGGYLMQHLQRAPVMIIPCIVPATWSLMLALRARRLASAWTTLHLQYERETSALLGIPDNYTQAALLPVAWLTGGDLKPATRLPLAEVAFVDDWGTAFPGKG
jgi:nitroreductase